MRTPEERSRSEPEKLASVRFLELHWAKPGTTKRRAGGGAATASGARAVTAEAAAATAELGAAHPVRVGGLGDGLAVEIGEGGARAAATATAAAATAT